MLQIRRVNRNKSNIDDVKTAMSHTRMVAPIYLLLELCPFDYFLRLFYSPITR